MTLLNAKLLIRAGVEGLRPNLRDTILPQEFLEHSGEFHSRAT